MGFYKKFLEIGCKVFHVIGTCSLAGIVIAVSCNVFARRVLGRPIVWTEELCTLLFIILAFSGACVSTYKKKHIVVDFLSKKFPAKTARGLNIAMDLLIIVFMGLVCVGSFYLQGQIRIIISVILQIPRGVFFLPLLLGSAYITLYYIYDIIVILTSKNETIQSVEGGSS